MPNTRSLHIKYIVVIIVLAAIVGLSLSAMFNRTARMFAAEDALSSAQSQLTGALSELSLKTTSLATAESELSKAQAGLTVAQSELITTRSTLQITAVDLTTKTEKLTAAETELAAASEQLAAKSILADTIQVSYDNIKVNLDRMTTGYGYVLRDPSYKEMMSFLSSDRTDIKTYNRDSYNCVDFSADFIANAGMQKIRCAFVNISFPDSGHAIIAFSTTDRGLIYIEPQSDEEVKLQTGKQFWQCVVPDPGYYYTKPSYDDSIEKFNVIW
jgi:hypothetical protein